MPQCCFHRLTVENVSARRGAVVKQAKSELQLLSMYGVHPTQTGPDPDHDIDRISMTIISMLDPDMSNDHVALTTAGDGNCLYRTVSSALFGSEDFHKYLRLLTAIEIILHRHCYDTGKEDNNFLQDIRIVTSSYDKLLCDALTDCAFSEMGHIYALSAALQIPIKSYYPPINQPELSSAFCRLVCGREVVSQEAPVHLMWSASSVPKSKDQFRVNHFVPLVKQCNVNEFAADVSGLRADETSDAQVALEDSDIDNDPFSISDFDNQIHSESDTDIESIQVRDPDTQIHSESDSHNAPGILTQNHRDSVLDSDTELDTVPDGDAQFHSDSVVSDSDSDSGGDSTDETKGSLPGTFLDTENCINILTQDIQGKDEIPSGIKENVYFVVKNTQNTDNRKHNKRSDFPDDCGIWDGSKGTTPKTTYIKFGTKYKQAYLKDGLLTYRKKNKGQITYIPYDTQPESSLVYVVHRYYAVSKRDKTYKKRVTWLESRSPNIAIVEYIGSFPGLSIHGNSTTDSEYIRLPPKVMNDITEMAGKFKPHQILNKLSDKYDDLQQPTSTKPIKNKIYNDKQKHQTTECNTDNFADQIRHLETLVTHNDDFVRSIFRSGGQTPTIILFTDDQIQDIKSLCCTGRTVLGVDKTFNLCRMHVTVTCFKQLAVKREKTDDSPIFLGPLLIHDASDSLTFSHFFHQIKLRLGDEPLSNLVTGSDEEKAMVKALETVFPTSQHVLCTRHLEQNARQILTDDTVSKSQSRHVLKRIFGDAGLVDANDSICFDKMATDIDQDLSEISQTFQTYYNKRLVHAIKNKVNYPGRQNTTVKHWTNNNCESINHVLKQTADWKKLPLPELVARLRELVNGQYKKLRNALFKTGDFRLTDSYKGFELSKSDWVKMTDKQRTNHFRRFRKFIPTVGKMVTSSDGKTTVMAPLKEGRKPGQRKRKPKTVSLPCKKRKL